MKFIFDLGKESAEITVDSAGVYLCGYLSGTGKTYLCDIVMRYIERGNDDVTLLTYRVQMEEKDYINEIVKGKSVIILDRLDLYLTSGIISALQSVEGKSVILVDYKSGCFETKFSLGRANVSIDEKGVKVYGRKISI